ncbi:WcaG Nucleoside-diphosphate-sugar epimerases [Spirosomataceae bacterium]
MKKKIGIIGAAGFVGVELIKQLQAQNEFDIVAIARSNGNFILGKYDLQLVNPKDLTDNIKVDIVINLAYPSHFYLYPAQNREIIDQIEKISDENSLIIHVSTQAVFGFELDSKIQTTKLKLTRDVPYVESKAMMEKMICDKLNKNKVHIVRLGNVWGPGSGTWTSELINRILFAQPVKVKGVDGYSNVTDVQNVASYLIHLLKSKYLTKEVEYHHLSEFCNVKWSEWIAVLEEYLNIKSVALNSNLSGAVSLFSELVVPLNSLKPMPIFKYYIGTRFASSYVRSLVRFIGYENYIKYKNKKRQPLPSENSLGPLDSLYLNIFSTDKEFQNIVKSDWSPKVNFQESCSNVKIWMKEVGYLNE